MVDSGQSQDGGDAAQAIELKEMTDISQRIQRDMAAERTDQIESTKEPMTEVQQETQIMEDLVEPDPQDWQLLRPQSQEAKKGSDAAAYKVAR